MPVTRRAAAPALALCLALLAPLACAQGASGEDLPTIGVEEITAARERGEDLLLVDVRSEEETAVSMIPGAIKRSAYERNPEAWADYRVVPYCTVGSRSARYTRALRKRGVPAVNFHDSIIGWVRAGQPLVTPDGEPTMRVHTYSPRLSVPAPYVQVTE